MQIGKTPIQVPPLGVGVWSWGERLFWGYGGSYGERDVTEAFVTSVNAGLTFYDTAEVYGMGRSEEILGKLIRQTRARVVVASKYLPWPWRLDPRSVRQACEGSLRRMGIERMDLYQVHAPISLIDNRRLMEALADLVEDGLVRAVGVSNYSVNEMRRAHEALARRGIPLASNQVEYSLVHRQPEVDGVLAACHELGVTLIAWSPLGKGLLSGRYTPQSRPEGARRFTPDFSAANLAAAQPLIQLLREIGQEHGGKTPAQVALNWLISREGVLAIPGAKNLAQASANAGALGWQISAEQRAALDQASMRWRRRY